MSEQFGNPIRYLKFQSEMRGKFMATKTLGRYIVADSAICHGEPTFRGTRILVADVLEQVANGIAWEAIIEEWRGRLSKEAIAEAVRLARDALVTHAPDLGTESARP
jgi:uncharacterized protein (DUF433 family)